MLDDTAVLILWALGIVMIIITAARVAVAPREMIDTKNMKDMSESNNIT